MTPEQLERVRRIAEAAVERKAEDVLALDVSELTSFADGFVLASGGSDRQVRAIADRILEVANAAGVAPLGVEGYEEGRWVLIDLGDLVIHVFVREARAHYDLERLWGDAPVIEFGEVAASTSERQRIP